eukprot:TRINITY_DN2956_c0_g1_i1.p1 TRINITY_DN2956_c0_g1~~TRINITY_DN2956_c0_g1_i1.p1  ORF type:complete len:108 (-),score=10.67 TRINITY_DN2956_c0_g1_i1:745-1068(-)
MRHKVRSICVVSKCELWIGTHQFITVLNTNNPELSIYQPESWMAHKNSSVNSIVVVNEDQIWSCGNTEINIWNNKVVCLKLKLPFASFNHLFYFNPPETEIALFKNT